MGKTVLNSHVDFYLSYLSYCILWHIICHSLSINTLTRHFVKDQFLPLSPLDPWGIAIINVCLSVRPCTIFVNKNKIIYL